ncbi:hypothetical protein [Actinomadura rubrisoli]|uniref:hypothetical protein n=1 Tax=Actinomadura rubrisoli TaxID=2530368 RepID=UPI0014047F60|nr:hypothetical protein [Actinomadura rubrisoli]
MPEYYMRVSYRHRGPYLIVWDDDKGQFRWHNGPLAGTELGDLDSLDTVTTSIGRTLGAGESFAPGSRALASPVEAEEDGLAGDADDQEHD